MFFHFFFNSLMMMIFSLNFIVMEKINFFEFEIYSLNSTSMEFTTLSIGYHYNLWVFFLIL